MEVGIFKPDSPTYKIFSKELWIQVVFSVDENLT